MDEEETKVPWSDNLESIKEFLSKDYIQIIDEYGEKFTFDQFWNNEIKDWIYIDKNHMCHDDYTKKYPNEFHLDSREKIKDKTRWIYCWFC